MVSPSCNRFKAVSRLVSLNPGLTLFVVLTVRMALWAAKQNRPSIAVMTIGFEFFMYAVVFGHASTIPDESAADSVQESAPALLSQYPSAGGRSAGNTRRGG